ncbi:MAG: hypothetical protein HY296_03340 [Thaumarchaeota archaeon]|nr:hypothetical protein [Nitrososphaerota archaeon]
MDLRAGIVSLVLNAISIALYPAIFFRIYDPQTVASWGTSYAYVMILSVFGLVLAPYFEVASFTSKKGTYWKEVSRLIHGHVSIPFIGGYALSISAVYPSAFLLAGFGLASSTLLVYFDFVLVAYLVFIFTSSAITIMANREPTMDEPPQSFETTP